MNYKRTSSETRTQKGSVNRFRGKRERRGVYGQSRKIVVLLIDSENEV